ncbi:MAG: hypothetical protein KJO79_07250 [Verrucomicrobiae bacterium]|nr:hypothetical protein [Verrucomicrobiae bacterium]NNJ86958.1 hypothetical protein [Akkermansiaceae bacterium]
MPQASAGLLALVLTACVDPGSPAFRRNQAQKLSRDLQRLASTVSVSEANKMAITAVEQSAGLSELYKPAHVAWFNNWLVNRGLRDRGLCYQWRNDLFPPLFRLEAKTLDLHLATSRRGTVFEHNAIVVTANNQAFEDGIILDPWRRGGKLWWGSFDQDKRRPWKKLNRDQTPMELRPLLLPRY